MDSFLKDLKYGLRMLVKNRSVTVIAIIALALGIGATTSIFSFVDAVIIRPLPYPHSQQLVGLGEDRIQKNAGFIQTGVSPLNVIDIQRANHVFQQVGYYLWHDYTLSSGVPPERLDGVRVSANILALLGIQPTMGRDFTAQEAQPGHDREAILSFSLWQKRFGGNLGIIGQVIQLDGEPYTVIGIMPRNFYFIWDQEIDVLTPLAFTPGDLSEAHRSARNLQTMARLKPGVSQAKAQADMDTVAAQLAEEYPQANKDWGIKVEPLHSAYHRNIAKPLTAVLIAVFLVLLIACVNVANLLLARSTGRRREIAIRLAMGASAKRLLAQLLTESVLLGLAGGVAGLLVATAGIRLLAIGCAHYFQMPGTQWITLDGHVLIFCFVIALLSGVLFGLAPALHASNTDVNEPLKEGSLTTTVEFGRRRLRNGLVMCEVALAVILMAGAGLLIHSFVNMLNVDLGFNPSNVLVSYIDLPNYKYKTDIQRYDFFHELLGRVRALPGVRTAAYGDALPLVMSGAQFLFVPEGEPRPAPGQEPTADIAPVSEGYFKALGVPLLQGRYFAPTDQPSSTAVAIVNQALIRRYSGRTNPLGQRLTILSNVYGEANQKINSTLQIVGVVGDYMSYDLRSDHPEVFIPYAQAPRSGAALIVQSSLPTGTLLPAIRRAVWSIDRQQPLEHSSTADDLVNETLGFYRFPMTVVWIFAALALILAAVGIFGVISYSVSQRTHEMAIRMALGARRMDVMRLVVGEGLRFTLAGLALGIAAALVLSRFIASFLYGVHSSDPLTFISVAMVMLVVAILAAVIPARRATRVDPMVALRYE
jgi:putative ABC transport system permease protein